MIASPAITPPVIVEALTVGRLFSGEFSFVLPWFQRAYAWPRAQVVALMADIADAMSATGKARHHPLGTLVLARAPDRMETALVDGHQRIMTLTILFAVLRDAETDPVRKAMLDALIVDPAKRLGPSGYRLVALGDTAGFLVGHVQQDGATVLEPDIDDHELSATEHHIIENRDYLRGEIARAYPSETARAELIEFLTGSCWVIVHIADDEDEAWRRLRLDEETKFVFAQVDQARSSILSMIPRADRQAAATAWSRCEDHVGEGKLYDLLGHLRFMKLRRIPATRPIEIDLAEFYDLRDKGLAFVEGIMLPSARRLRQLQRLELSDPVARRSLEGMWWSDSRVWAPAALLWLEHHGADHVGTADFFRGLERFVWLNRIAGADTHKRDRRLLQLVRALQSGLGLDAGEALTIEPQLLSQAVEQLRSPRFGAKQHAGALLRRISVVWGADPGPIDKVHTTMEHLLPRNPGNKSDWMKAFRSRKQARDYVNRLGNLTLMTAEENQNVGCKEWPMKRPVLAVTPFALSRGLAACSEWNAKSIDERTETMIAALLDDWRLNKG